MQAKVSQHGTVQGKGQWAQLECTSVHELREQGN